MRTTIAALLALGLVRGVWAATYTNPVLTMDFSDPDVCEGPDGRYYLTASSFGGLPGLPILASDDLVNWQYVGHALARHPFETESPEHGNAVWAPAIRYHAGAFVIYWGDPDRGIWRVTAKEAAGPWSAPVLVKPGRGLIDPCPLYDDDGRIYLVHARAQSRALINSVLTVSELNADETAVVGEEVLVYDGVPDGNFTAEGPKFYKKGGEYWLFFPAGGVGGGWQVAARQLQPVRPVRGEDGDGAGRVEDQRPAPGRVGAHARGRGLVRPLQRPRRLRAHRLSPADGVARRRLAGDRRGPGRRRLRHAGQRVRDAEGRPAGRAGPLSAA